MKPILFELISYLLWHWEIWLPDILVEVSGSCSLVWYGHIVRSFAVLVHEHHVYYVWRHRREILPYVTMVAHFKIASIQIDLSS